MRGTQTNDALTVLENIIAPGDGPPLHRHANEDDEFAALEDGPVSPDVFGSIGRAVGMDVVGPPLAVSDPI